MEYKGKLYGRIGNKYFETGETSETWDSLNNSLVEAKKHIENLRDYNFTLTENRDLMERESERYMKLWLNLKVKSDKLYSALDLANIIINDEVKILKDSPLHYNIKQAVTEYKELAT